MRQKRRPKERNKTTRQQRDKEIYPLPNDTCSLAKAKANQCLNYGLMLERFLPWNRTLPHRQGESDEWELTKQAKERFTKQVKGQKVLNFTQDELDSLIRNHKERWEAMLNDCLQRGYEVKQFPMRAESRIIVGLGAESVLETSIRLHRIYGFPIIPGSALKGLARSYAEMVEGKKEGDCIFDAVFGKVTPSASAGKVIFFDAIPVNPAKLKLELDVMNPHYSDYYMKKKFDRSERQIPPADYLSPVPIFFLTIASGSEFLFAIASKEADLAQRAEDWLKKGLMTMGIGAKTTSGYGLWR